MIVHLSSLVCVMVWCVCCLSVCVLVQVELDKASDLFYLAHKLVDEYPKAAVAWYAVGCYYVTRRAYDAGM